MHGDTCVVNTQAIDKSVSMHRFPQDEVKWQQWIEEIGLQDVVIKDHHRFCSHFSNGDARNDPQLTLGKRFGSPKKQWTGRAKRPKKCEGRSSNSLTLFF